MAIPRPRVGGFGNSFAEDITGCNIFNAKSKGNIDTSALNNLTETDFVEFNPFEEKIKDYVKAKLGHPVVRVELSDFQLKTCIDEAISKLNYHAPYWTTQYATFEASSGINIYEIPRYILDNLTYVVYKKTLLSIQSQAGTLEFDFFIKYFQDNFLMRDFDIANFYLLQQHLEILRKVLGQEGTFDIINNQYLQIYPMPVVTPQTVILEFRALDDRTLHPYYRNFIQKFATCCAKKLLGEIRGKFSSLPSPQGGAQLNGERLVLEAINEQDKLEEELIWAIDEPPTFTVW